ncbi:hypothetical protein RB195_000301 [Necator americanus]|uniref:EF-hand domain-containing protein n=1 Tax=Necator americanus TaxID=51031 RepID=A0ABR1D8Z5_NECAM
MYELETWSASSTVMEGHDCMEMKLLRWVLGYFLSRIMKETDSEMIREAFRVFDKDGNGVITANEFKYFMVHMGMQFSEEEVEEMMQEVDCDGNGEIDYEEFVKMMSAA